MREKFRRVSQATPPPPPIQKSHTKCITTKSDLKTKTKTNQEIYFLKKDGRDDQEICLLLDIKTAVDCVYTMNSHYSKKSQVEKSPPSALM